MNELALFAGAGGGVLGGHLLGWRTVCAVEFDAYARSVLIARQRDGCLPRFPIWDDVRTFDGNPWCGHVDVVSGGFPCQDISAAGKGAGIDGERSGLWREMARIVGEVRPRFVWVENSPLLVDRGLAVVLGDLAKMGYDSRWGIVGAHHAGAPHKRDRCWIVAHTNLIHDDDGRHDAGEIFGQRRKTPKLSVCQDLAHADSERGCGRETWKQNAEDAWEPSRHPGVRWWQSEPQLGGVADGMAAGLDVHGTHAGIDVGRVARGIPKRAHRLRCIGNGQVPAAIIQAWNELANPPAVE